MTQTNIEQDIIDDAIQSGFNAYSQNNELSLDFDKALLMKLVKFAQLQRERQAIRALIPT